MRVTFDKCDSIMPSKKSVFGFDDSANALVCFSSLPKHRHQHVILVGAVPVRPDSDPNMFIWDSGFDHC